MDAEYLKLNVNDVLVKALTSMKIVQPNDPVEYLGNYLLQYVNKQKDVQSYQANLNVVETQYNDFIKNELKKQAENDIIKQNEQAYKNQLIEFLKSYYFGSAISTKQQAMDQAVEFLSSYCNIPSVYIGMKKTRNETDYLYYYSCNAATAKKIVGKKLVKPSAEYDVEDEATYHQGVTFDAFIVPVVEEEESNEESNENDENGEKKEPSPPPKPQPIIIENVMREKRIKFFGIPMLGSFVAVPFAYNSTDHETGYLPRNKDDQQQQQDDEGNGVKSNEPPSKYAEAYTNQEFVIAFDSIGKYRSFTSEDIELVQKIGSAMTKLFEQIEKKTVDQQKDFLELQSATHDSVMKAYNKIRTDESQLGPIAVDAESSDPDAPAPLQSYKPLQESLSVLQLWSSQLTNEPLSSSIASLNKHVLPLSQSALNVLYSICLLLGYSSQDFVDEFGDISWDKIKKNGIINELASKMSSYDPSRRQVLKEGTIDHIKSYIESNNVNEFSLLPNHLPIFNVLLTWLQKAVNARENAVAYHREAHEQDMELIVSKIA